MNAAAARRLSQVRIDALRTEHRSILWAGESLNPALPFSGQRGRTRQSDATNLLIRLRNYEDGVLRFTFDPDAPFTNNIATRHKQKFNLYDSLVQALQGSVPQPCFS